MRVCGFISMYYMRDAGVNKNVVSSPCVSRRKNKDVRRFESMERGKDNSDVTHYARARIRKAEETA